MMRDTAEGHLQTYARLAGFAYLLQNVVFFASLIITSRTIVAGDFAATAKRIAASEQLYRGGILFGLVASASTILLAGAFYALLKPVNGNLARFALLFRVAEAIFYGAMYLIYLIGLEICKGATSDLGETGQQALWDLALRSEIAAGLVSSVYFCLGSTIFFYLLFKARFIPRIISLFGMLTTFSILITTCWTIIAPVYEARLQVVGLPLGAVVGLPLAAAEILTGLWLLLAGASPKYWNGGNENLRSA
jgi:hypothetical protein